MSVKQIFSHLTKETHLEIGSVVRNLLQPGLDGLHRGGRGDRIDKEESFRRTDRQFSHGRELKSTVTSGSANRILLASIDTQYINNIGWLVGPLVRHTVKMTFPNIEICMKVQLFMMILPIMMILMIMMMIQESVKCS